MPNWVLFGLWLTATSRCCNQIGKMLTLSINPEISFPVMWARYALEGFLRCVCAACANESPSAFPSCRVASRDSSSSQLSRPSHSLRLPFLPGPPHRPPATSLSSSEVLTRRFTILFMKADFDPYWSEQAGWPHPNTLYSHSFSMGRCNVCELQTFRYIRAKRYRIMLHDGEKKKKRHYCKVPS